MTDSYRFTIPLKPRPKPRPRLTKRGYAYTPKNYAEYEKEIATYYKGPKFDGLDNQFSLFGFTCNDDGDVRGGCLQLFQERKCIFLAYLEIKNDDVETVLLEYL